MRDEDYLGEQKAEAAAVFAQDEPEQAEHATRERAEEKPHCAEGEAFPPPGEPMKVARQLMEAYLDDCGDGGAVPMLRSWRGSWMRWDGFRWFQLEDRSLRADVYKRLEKASYLKEASKATTIEPWAPTKRKVADVMEALAAVAHLAETVDPPVWLRVEDEPDGPIVACSNGLLRVGTRELQDHTPEFFNLIAVPFAYQPDPPKPSRWLKFLNELWPDDPDSIRTLQQWFGYVVSGRTNLQKILLLIGPKRSGKGTIARVLTAMVGKGNMAGPTLASLATPFGLQPLLGKSLAIVADARLSGANASTVVERLLSISGEDYVTVDLKYRDPWTGRIPSRFMLLSNELPKFGDSSGAIASRFVVLQTSTSFLGTEDVDLEDALYAELPGILRWSLDGLADLDKERRFTVPKSSADAVSALQDLVSPISAFVRDRCVIGVNERVPVDEIHAAWREWCEENVLRPTARATFGRDLRAAYPSVKGTRPRIDGSQVHYWTGIALNPKKKFPDSPDSPDSPRSVSTVSQVSRAIRENSSYTCTVCGSPLPPALAEAGETTHPTCGEVPR